MTSSMLPIALVGIGKIVRDQHIPAINDSGSWQLAAAVSRHAKVDGVENFTDFATMLDARPDIPVVSLCMPPQARYDYASRAIEAGRHVMMEKPPGATLSECNALVQQAQSAGVTLYATWHSRHAHAVSVAKEWLAERTLRRLAIVWKEDVRRWHPGQEWIWEAGGLGVLDPGINALSILTEISPVPLHLKSAVLEFPDGRDTPIAAQMVFNAPADIEVTADMDWRQEGPQTWDIVADTDDGSMQLSDGGACLRVNGTLVSEGPDREYPALYARMAELVAQGASEVDLSPMTHVADAFTLGKRVVVEPFSF